METKEKRINGAFGTPFERLPISDFVDLVINHKGKKNNVLVYFHEDALEVSFYYNLYLKLKTEHKVCINSNEGIAGITHRTFIANNISEKKGEGTFCYFLNNSTQVLSKIIEYSKIDFVIIDCIQSLPYIKPNFEGLFNDFPNTQFLVVSRRGHVNNPKRKFNFFNHLFDVRANLYNKNLMSYQFNQNKIK